MQKKKLKKWHKCKKKSFFRDIKKLKMNKTLKIKIVQNQKFIEIKYYIKTAKYYT